MYRSTGILFRPISPGSQILVSRLPDRSFFDGLDELTGYGKRRMRAVMRKLSNYRRYHAQIESHASMRGDEETNLLKSELRASRAHAYFLKKGIDRNKIDFRGMGETEPLKEDSSEYYDYRNSRMEIRLFEKKKP
jgi:outer membrane protein OmpA-like peptidoglycan-associated protein